MPQIRKHPGISDKDSASVKPIIHLEQLEPRILLSGDSLLNIAIDPQQDTIIDNTPQVVQYAELLDINEQVEEQFNLELAQSDGPNADTYQPIFTLLAEDDNRNNEPVKADLSVDNIDPNQVNGEIAVLSNDSNGDIEGKVGTTEDDSMPTNINDADLSIEYATSIEIRGPPTSETFTLQGMYLVDPTVNYFEGQIIFLDFDGEQDVTYNGPVIVEDINIPEFSAKSGGLASQDQEIISQILTALEQKFESTGVQFTTSVPDPSTSYSTIFVGGGDCAFAQYGSFLGLAEKVDVGNQDSGDNAFVFSDTIRARYADNDDCLKRLADVIAHEAAHILGYAHDSVYSSEGMLASVSNNVPTVVANNTQVAVDEGGIAGNTGIFSDVDQGDSVAITPSIGTITQTGSQSGTWNWSFNTTNGPVESQIVTITATDSGGEFNTTTFDLVVNNVAPVLSDVEFNDGTTHKSSSEGQRLNVGLVGQWTDPGAEDSFRVEIDWGDGTGKTVQTYGAGSHQFSLSHRFEDDYGPGQANTNSIIVKVFDDDSFGIDNTVSFTVFNEEPTLIDNLSVTPSQLEGQPVLLRGIISDPGVLDWFTLDVDWGDGSIEGMVITKEGNNPNLDHGGNFTVSHVYNNAQTAPYTVYSVRVLGLSDDDGAQDTQDQVSFPDTVRDVQITPVNDAPVANDDTAVTDEDTPVNVDVLANDTDEENDPLSITILSSTNGTAVVNDGGTPADPSDDTVDVTPNAGFYGIVQFTYQVVEGGTFWWAFYR